MKRIMLFIFPVSIMLFSCSGGISQKKTDTSNQVKMFKLMTVDPGHFHAALVQKSMYAQLSNDVYVFAPEGSDLQQHLDRIKSFNARSDSPTSWNEIVYSGADFFEKMISEKPGNVVVLSGNNRKKADYIVRSVNAGLNVLADKPMIINAADFPLLEEAFSTASKNGVLLYDIMTERYEITTILQKALSRNEEIFGRLQAGSIEEPAVEKVSVHHFAKYVSGKSLIRPSWFFDVEQQGEGIVDVTTHLVDLVQWECFPDSLLSKHDIEIGNSKRWATQITKDQFREVTGTEDYPGFLEKDIKNGDLSVFSNGEFVYRIKGIWAKVSVEWKFKAPEGGGDTHYSIMRGSNCNLVIRQTAEEKFKPELYVEKVRGSDIDAFSLKLKKVLASLPYDSITVVKVNADVLRIGIPAKYRVSHEDHFAQVTSKFLNYLNEGKIPEWEIQAMITKYYTTTSALKKAIRTDSR